MDISDFVSRLDKARATGNNRWTARCPAHEDKNPSLTVSVGDDGRVLVKCFAECSFEDICNAANVSMSDMMPEKALGDHFKPIPGRRRMPAADVLEMLRTESMIVWLAGCDISKGKTLDAVYLERLNLACARIEEAING